jgi:hypothetical protein
MKANVNDAKINAGKMEWKLLTHPRITLRNIYKNAKINQES